MKTQEIMSTPAVTCRANDTLNTAAQLMWDHDCGVLPVVGDEGRVVGIVTDRDICMATYTKGRPPQAIRVADAMARQVFSCHTTDPVETVERLMSDKKIRRVPVVDGDNRPVGVLSLNDLARYSVSRKKEGIEHEVIRTLAAICEPRSEATVKRSARPQVRPLQEHRPVM